MDSEMRSLTDLLHQISTRPISKVREMRRLVKGVLNPVLHEDPGVTLTSPPEVAVTKGRKKTDSRKRDKSHWEHNVIGDENYGYRVVADFVFGDEHQWPEVRRGMLYELEHSANLYVNLLGSEERTCVVRALVRNTLFALHRSKCIQSVCDIIAQLGSTTVLPLYLYSNRPEGTLVIGFLTEERYFIQLQLNDMCPIPPLHVQWIHHRSGNWADSYQHRIADWNATVARNRK
ncbi:hypothetical protein M9H77_25573 [Catharanthus roseus]|uniref:Uncharacterized protein n=1 Tax=Catharanthus roseus TaxID=4058 RepID=A0ACC0A942_CATRO|nr:hypothetical protein M9H77_25573 [Catharanthus roseus]